MTLSVSNCRSNRIGPAPMASRTASSRLRDMLRASSMLATFAHAMSSTEQHGTLKNHEHLAIGLGQELVQTDRADRTVHAVPLVERSRHRGKDRPLPAARCAGTHPSEESQKGIGGMVEIVASGDHVARGTHACAPDGYTKSGGHDADNRPLHAVGRQRFADDSRSPANARCHKP